VAGLINILLGDDRYYNNIFAPDKITAGENKYGGQFGLEGYNAVKWPVWIASNLYFNGAKPYGKEMNSIENPDFDPEIRIEDKGNEVFLLMNMDESPGKVKTQMVTSALLGKAKMPDARFERPDGGSLAIDTDYLGKKRDGKNPSVGPFENPGTGKQIKIKVW
jgi:hypothetical protein